MTAQPDQTSQATIRLTNSEGLHARPAAQFATLAGTFRSTVTVNGVDAKSLLRILTLGLAAGEEASIVATGPDAAEAVAALIQLVGNDFAGSQRSIPPGD